MPGPNITALTLMEIFRAGDEYRGMNAYYQRGEMRLPMPEGWEIAYRHLKGMGGTRHMVSIDKDTGELVIGLRRFIKGKSTKRGRPFTKKNGV